MRKAFLYIAAAATLLAGCAKEADQVPEVQKGVYTITATLDGSQTRSIAGYDSEKEKYVFSWASDETIAVVPEDAVKVLSFEVSDAANGIFTYTPAAGESYDGFSLAVSPEEALLEKHAGNNDPYVLEDEADYYVRFSGNYTQGKSNAILIGTPVAGTNYKFSFKHAAAVVRVTYNNVPAGTAGMRFTAKKNATENATITGVSHCEFLEIPASGIAQSDLSPLSATSNSSEAVVWFDDATTTDLETVDFYLPIPTGSYQSFTVSLFDGSLDPVSGSEKTFSTSTPFTVSRADVVQCPAVTIQEKAGDKYVKVTSGLDDYTGDYLIVYGPYLNNEVEDEYVAFNGGLTTLDAVGNGAIVDVVDGAVAFTEETYGYQFHIDKIGDTGNYYIQSKSGKYIGIDKNVNGLLQNDNTQYPHTISIDEDGDAVISAVFQGSTMTMRYNSASNQERFRYYKSGQSPVALYKLNGQPDVTFPVLSAEDVTIAANETTATVTFTTNQDWSVTTNSDLLVQNLNVAGSKDVENKSVTLTFKAENASFTEDKEVVVVITAGTLTKQVTVTQSHVVPVLTLSSTSTSVGASATAASFNVTSCNFDWDVVSVEVNDETAPSGFSASIDAEDNTKVNVVFPSNVDPALTTDARSIVVTVGDSDIKTATFTITQEGNVIQGDDNEKTDVITLATTGVTGTGYSDWTWVASPSGAEYAGNSSGGNSSVQLRATTPSGIVSTKSGGKVKKVSVSWNSNTSSGRTVNVYGSNTAYSSTEDLYSSSDQGTLLGTIVYGESTELTITGNYKYIGLRSASGALYLTEIKITWDKAPAVKYSVSVSSGITNGTVSVTNGNVAVTEAEAGDVLTLTATGNTGTPEYLFREWSITGLTLTEAQKKTNPLTITMPANAITVSASFVVKPTEETYTYTFTSKSWEADLADWTSGQDGAQLTSGQGVQVTTGVSGAYATSPRSYTNISQIVVTYCTNASKGAGSIVVKVGENDAKTFTVTKPSSGGTTLKTATFNYNPNESGSVKLTVNCTTNSIYIHSIAIVAE